MHSDPCTRSCESCVTMQAARRAGTLSGRVPMAHGNLTVPCSDRFLPLRPNPHCITICSHESAHRFLTQGSPDTFVAADSQPGSCFGDRSQYRGHVMQRVAIAPDAMQTCYHTQETTACRTGTFDICYSLVPLGLSRLSGSSGCKQTKSRFAARQWLHLR